MGWSKKYKRSIDCNNPKGFSQKAHCAGRKKRENVMSSKLEELVGKPITEAQFDEEVNNGISQAQTNYLHLQRRTPYLLAGRKGSIPTLPRKIY